MRIDTAIQPTSYLRGLLYIALIVSMIILVWLTSLAWWQIGIILLVSIMTTLYLSLSRPTLLHLTQPPVSQPIDRQWQLLMRTGRGDELWQAQLVAAHRYRWAIHLAFTITEPYQRSSSVTVFRDQVTDEQWRELNVLANISGKNPQ